MWHREEKPSGQHKAWDSRCQLKQLQGAMQQSSHRSRCAAQHRVLLLYLPLVQPPQQAQTDGQRCKICFCHFEKRLSTRQQIHSPLCMGSLVSGRLLLLFFSFHMSSHIPRGGGRGHGKGMQWCQGGRHQHFRKKVLSMAQEARGACKGYVHIQVREQTQPRPWEQGQVSAPPNHLSKRGGSSHMKAFAS